MQVSLVSGVVQRLFFFFSPELFFSPEKETSSRHETQTAPNNRPQTSHNLRPSSAHPPTQDVVAQAEATKKQVMDLMREKKRLKEKEALEQRAGMGAKAEKGGAGAGFSTSSLTVPKNAYDFNRVLGSLRSAPLVATGSVVLEPSSDRTWGNDFFSDAYWQRHDSRRFFQQEPVQPPRRAFR